MFCCLPFPGRLPLCFIIADVDTPAAAAADTATATAVCYLSVSLLAKTTQWIYLIRNNILCRGFLGVKIKKNLIKFMTKVHSANPLI